MTVAAPIPALVKRIVPTLGSPVDGEALGACRAIGRVLDRAGLGFTDLAAAIPTADFLGADKIVPAPEQGDVRHHGFSRRREDLGAGAQSEFSRRREDPVGANRIRPFDAYAWKRTFTPKQEAEHRARVRFCQDRVWRLNDWERGFLNNVAKLHGNLSIRQGDRLAALTDRLDMEARRAC